MDAQAQEAHGRLGKNGAGEGQGSLNSEGGHDVGRDVADQDRAGPDAHGLGVLDILQPLGGDDRGADRPGEHGNIDDADGNHGVHQPAAQHCGDKDGQQDGGKGEKDIPHTHNDAVHPALEISGDEPQDIACSGGDAHGDDANLQRDAGAVQDAAENVAPIIIRPEPKFGTGRRLGEADHFFRAEMG